MYYSDHGNPQARPHPRAEVDAEADAEAEAGAEAETEADALGPEHDRPKRGRDMGLKKSILEFLAGVDDDDEEPNELGVGESGADEAAADEVAPDEAAPADAPDAGAGDENAEEVAADDADETLPASEVSLAELRDEVTRLAAENESLRNRIAELGGDSAADDVEADEAEEVEEEAHYDDEAAQADLDEQAAQIAALRGGR